MTGRDRKAELVRRGVRQRTIARRLGVSSTAVSDVVSGRSRSARIEQLIAEALGLPIEEVFAAREPPGPVAPETDALPGAPLAAPPAKRAAVG